MSRKSKSLLCSALGGLCVLIASCGCPAQKSPASPFHHAAEPTRDRDWPLEKELMARTYLQVAGLREGEQLARLEAPDVGLPLIELPLLLGPSYGRDEIRELAKHIEEAA